MTSRWMTILLGILAACCLADPASAAQFVEVGGLSDLPRSVGLGWGDYDDDGYPDLFLAGTPNGTQPHGPLLYRNQGDLTFAEVGQSMGLPASIMEQDAVGWADYDNDGDLDVLVASGSRFPYLYRRDPAGFVEVGEAAGLNKGGTTRSVAWCDYDGDGLLDVFVPTNGLDSYLYHNNGDGTFTDVHAEAGIILGTAAGIGGQSADWGDYDNDGDPDLLISRIRGAAMLYRNNSDGTSTDVSSVAGVTVPVDCYSAVWGDYDNDGWLDCYLSSGSYLEPQARQDWLFHNNADGTFSEVTAQSGMVVDLRPAFGIGWADYDNDGYLDLYVGNWGGPDPFLFHNNGNGTFADVVIGSGLESIYHNMGVAWGDCDLDGRLDLAEGVSADGQGGTGDATALFHNTGPAGNWLRVRALTGGTGDATDGSVPSRDAIGVRVDLNLDNDDSFASGRTLARMVGGGAGHGAQAELVQHFGLGPSTLVAVRVRFPDGSVVTHRSVPANQQIVIRDVPADRTEEPFDDVPLDYWAYEQVVGCVDVGIVGGYDDELYHGEWPVTRDQMAVYIARAMAAGEDNVPAGPPEATFDDVPTGYWAYDHVEHCYANNVVEGYDAVTYVPAGQVTRDQMAVYVARAMVAPTGEAALADYVPSDPHDFPDVPDTFWAYKHIEYCVENGVVQGYLDGYYRPEALVTRDQMAVYVARAFGLGL